MDGDIHIDDVGDSIEETLVCTPASCIQDNDKFKVECKECKRLVHYRCTRLPLYQLQQFLTKNYRQYICENCIVVHKDLPETVNEVTGIGKTERSFAKVSAELAIVKAELKQLRETYDGEKKNTSKLTTKLRGKHPLDSNSNSKGTHGFF